MNVKKVVIKDILTESHKTFIKPSSVKKLTKLLKVNKIASSRLGVVKA
jgi:hypothetical protein